MPRTRSTDRSRRDLVGDVQHAGDRAAAELAAALAEERGHPLGRVAVEARHLSCRSRTPRSDGIESKPQQWTMRAPLSRARLVVGVDHAPDELGLAAQVAVVGAGAGARADQLGAVAGVGPDRRAHHVGALRERCPAMPRRPHHPAPRGSPRPPARRAPRRVWWSFVALAATGSITCCQQRKSKPMRNPILWLTAVGVVLLVGLGVWYGSTRTNRDSQTNQSGTPATATTKQPAILAADQAGKELSAQHCVGSDKPLIPRLPMNQEDYAMILPYGLVVGAHVTPIDHQYFSPTDFNSAPDTYNVYAVADARLVGISTRQHNGFGDYADQTVTDYRLVFAISCRLLYYYDLVTSLAPDIQAAYAAQGNNIDLPVTAGQLIGKIGGQTLDYAVWDTEHKLTGFVNLDDYSAEAWKQYTADPLNYYTDEAKALALAKYARQVEPRSGKIDYDVDGRLIGNWFQTGTHGYNGLRGESAGNYWTGHLSLAPDYLDPSAWVLSIGNWPGGAKQFAAKEDSPNPAEVSLETGLVKYTLVDYRSYVNGQNWDGMTLPTGPISLHKYPDVQGCFLVQMTATRNITAEAFPGKSCASVENFSDAAVTYER